MLKYYLVCKQGGSNPYFFPKLLCFLKWDFSCYPVKAAFPDPCKIASTPVLSIC